jgi:hypothetical protein
MHPRIVSRGAGRRVLERRWAEEAKTKRKARTESSGYVSVFC